MKKSAVSLAAVSALLGVVVLGGPALAQNRSNIVTQSTVDSAFFGFVASPAHINTFMQKDATSDADAIAGTFDDYVKNNHMPGSYTDRPDSGGNSLRTVNNVVSSVPDFGCGVWTNVGAGATPLTGGTACDETTINLHDRVNGNVGTIVTTADALNSGTGQNTAPTNANDACGGAILTGNHQTCGTLVGTLTSIVTIAQAADDTNGMPSGSIAFTRSETGVSSFDQNILQTVDGLYAFNEHDRTEDGSGPATFTALIPGAPTVVGGQCNNYVSGPCGTGAGRTSGGTGVIGSYIGTGLPIRATLDLTQTTLGGEGTTTDAIGYTVDFPGNGTHPIAGMFFTPGLNVADWANTTAVDTAGFPN